MTILDATQRCNVETISCNNSKQCRNNVATLCCAKKRHCESSRVTSPLSTQDGDYNENCEKAIDDFTRAARFFVHFFTVIARLWRVLPGLWYSGGRELKNHYMTFSNLDTVP